MWATVVQAIDHRATRYDHCRLADGAERRPPRAPGPDDAGSLATPALKTAAVTLPVGTVVDASAADGLQACSQSQFDLNDASEPSCPNASKIGSAEIDSPIQADPLVGGIYLAQQNANPFGSLLAIYVSAESDGVLIKLAGHVVADPVTGQLVTTFDNNPQLPFSDFKLDFFGGRGRRWPRRRTVGRSRRRRHSPPGAEARPRRRRTRSRSTRAA